MVALVSWMLSTVDTDFFFLNNAKDILVGTILLVLFPLMAVCGQSIRLKAPRTRWPIWTMTHLSGGKRRSWPLSQFEQSGQCRTANTCTAPDVFSVPIIKFKWMWTPKTDFDSMFGMFWSRRKKVLEPERRFNNSLTLDVRQNYCRSDSRNT